MIQLADKYSEENLPYTFQPSTAVGLDAADLLINSIVYRQVCLVCSFSHFEVL